MIKKEKVDLILLLIYPIIASLLSFITKANVFLSILIFFGIPSVYLSFRAKKYVLKSLIFSIIAGLPSIFMIDYIAHITKTWLVPLSIFNFRFLNYVTIEVLLWMVFYIYFITMFYEYFLDKHVTKKLYTKNMKYLIIILLVLIVLFFSIFIIKPDYLHIPYFYLVSGTILGLIPILLVLLKFPKLFSKLFKTTAYFFFLTFAYEVTALKLGWWNFPGNQFLGWVTFLGIRFPFEEFFFWIILGALGILSYYEFFDEDRK